MHIMQLFLGAAAEAPGSLEGHQAAAAGKECEGHSHLLGLTIAMRCPRMVDLLS